MKRLQTYAIACFITFVAACLWVIPHEILNPSNRSPQASLKPALVDPKPAAPYFLGDSGIQVSMGYIPAKVQQNS